MSERRNPYAADFESRASAKNARKPNGVDHGQADTGSSASQVPLKARRHEKRRNEPDMPAPPDPSADDNGFVVIPAGFTLDQRGLYYQPPPTAERTASPIFICSFFEVLGECRSARSNEWGLLISWLDRDGASHRLAITKSRAHKEDSELFALLESEGLMCSTTRAGHGHFRRFLVTVRANRRIRNVARTGWHPVDDGWAFVLPSGDVVGAANNSVVLQAETNTVVEGYEAVGTLTDWQHKVARLAVGNDLLGLAISANFASPLIDISAGQSNTMLHIYGPSQSGKTTVQRAAISVWGVNAETSKGTLLKSWRSTSNGIESAAAESNDLLIALGELGEVSGKDAAAIAYMLGNGAAKSRANRSGGARPRETFRLLGLSTGEVRLASKLAEDRLSETAGQEVRFLELRVDGGAGHGIFQHLHGYESSGTLAEDISASLNKFHGTAGREFLARLVADRNADTARLANWIEDQIRIFLNKNLGNSKATAVRSAARRFGLVAAAGELAIAYGVLPWPPGEAARAVGAYFARWIEGRPSGTEAFEDGAAVTAVRSFIEAHGDSRFTRINDPDPGKFDRPTNNRAGGGSTIPRPAGAT